MDSCITYEVMKKLAAQLKDYDPNYADHLQTIVSGIRTDFDKYILSSGTIPGFVYMEDPEHVELMIHPEDKKDRDSVPIVADAAKHDR